MSADQETPAIAIGQFCCPECGGYRFGTSNCIGPKSQWVGHCHSDGCRFTWPRSDDAKYFHKGTQTEPVTVPEWIVMGYGETDYPEFAAAHTKEQAFDAVCGMMYSPGSSMPDDEREAWKVNFDDPDNWRFNGKRWEVKFEIGGIEVTRIELADAPTLPSVQEVHPDTERLDRMIAEECQFESLTLPGGTRYRIRWPDLDEAMPDWHKDPRAAIDAARAAGEATEAKLDSMQALPDIEPWEKQIEHHGNRVIVAVSEATHSAVLRELTEYRALFAQLKGKK